MTSQQAYQEAERMYQVHNQYSTQTSPKAHQKADKFYEAYLKLLKLGDKLKDQAPCHK